jgi:hypothetical protein
MIEGISAVTLGTHEMPRAVRILPRAGAGSDLFQLDQIRTPDDGIFMDAVEVRFVPETSTLQFGRPAGAACTQITNGLDKCSPVVAIDPRRHGRTSSGCPGMSVSCQYATSSQYFEMKKAAD